MSAPTFAVVGRPNKGKSSIVATLARDDSVYIDAKAGSTRESRIFPMRVDGETLYELVDTPGIQRARAVLSWLNDHCTNASERPETVRKFLDLHKDDPRFHDECEMLTPIVMGAGIIYVVDGSVPFGADYEAEMEILRWSGRPSLAVINPIDNERYVDEWSAGLGQYFRTVRTFNAQRAEAAKQLELLELFGHLDTHWKKPLDRAVDILRKERERQHRSSSAYITGMIFDSLLYRSEQHLLDGLPEEPLKKILFQQYRSHLVALEQHCRSQVEALFYYSNVGKSEESVALQESDLFNMERWYLWGLSKKSLVSLAASVGLVTGGSAGLFVDAATGGLTGGLGTAISGIGGALSLGVGAWKYSAKIGSIKVKGLPTGGKLISYGPSKNLNFPFVLLGRALLHHRLISQRTHAVRARLDLNQSLLTRVSEKDRKTLARLFVAIQNEKKLAHNRAELSTLVFGWCEQADDTANAGEI